MMLARIIQFLIGAGFGAGGGYLAWTHRAEFSLLFPPGPAGLPLMLIAGVAALAVGIVFLASAMAPRPKRTARLQQAAARRAETLRAADTYYAERSRAADRDWRSGKLPSHTPAATPASDPLFDPEPIGAERPEARPAPRFEPEPASVHDEDKHDPLFDPAPPEAEPARGGERFAEPVARPAPLYADPAPRAAAAKPVATSVPPTAMAFPSTATLSPIPKSSEAPPIVPPFSANEAMASMQAAAPAVALAPTAARDEWADPAFAEIRAALADGRLEEADRLLNASRETATGLALAELTGLAGDHAAAAGRQSNAKWLWKLSLKRFGEAGALDSPAARQVSERLRLAGP
jgi:hypothetical protein